MKKLNTEQKIKLIYCGELVLIAIIALVIGILKLTGVMQTKPNRLFVYNIITSAGAIWFVVDLVWALVSKKRRKKVSLLDKALLLPVSGYLAFFDIYCFIHKAQGIEVNDMLVRLSVGIVLCYVAVIYIFQAFYHYKYPLPSLIEAIEEAKKAEEEEKNKENAPLDEQKEEQKESKE